jgi:hypothetical protein
MTQNVTADKPISSYFQQYTINRTESYEQDTVVSKFIQTLVSF